MRRIRESFRVRNVCQVILVKLFDVDLQAHDSVFCQILVCFGTCRNGRTCHILEESFERLSFDGVPAEERVGAWQHLSEAEETFACFVRGVPQLVLKELGRSEQECAHASLVWSVKIYLDFTAATTAIRICFHMCVELDEGVVVHASSDIEHEAQFGLQVLADALEEPPVRVDLTVVAVLDGECDVHPAAFEDVLLKSKVPRRHLPHMQDVLRDVFLLDSLVHDILEVFHLVDTLIVLGHVAIRDENLLIKEALLAS